jgi:hypothetical protein
MVPIIGFSFRIVNMGQKDIKHWIENQKNVNHVWTASSESI